MDLVSYVQRLGFACRVYEEWGVSVTRLERRPKENSMLGDLQSGRIHGIAVAELSRLTRDTRGIDACFIGHLLRVHAEGRLITFGKVFDLPRTDDWQLFQTLTMFAALQRGAIREMLYAGYVKSAERQPILKGRVKVGYKRVESPSDRSQTGPLSLPIRTTLEKDDEQAIVMTALAREFERQPTLPDVVRSLRVAGIRRPNAKGRGVREGFWESRDLRAILLDPVLAARLVGAGATCFGCICQNSGVAVSPSKSASPR